MSGWLKRVVVGKGLEAEGELARREWDESVNRLRAATAPPSPTAEFDRHAEPLVELARTIASMVPPPIKDP